MMRTPSTRRGPSARRDPRRYPPNHQTPIALRPGQGGGAETGDLVRDAHLAAVEAALFAAEDPLTPKKLAQVIEVPDVAEVRRLVERLAEFLDRDGSSFQIEEIAGGWQLRTRPEYHPWLARLRRPHADHKLSPSALETLAIIAYRQPIMRADIEAIRGVQCGELLRHLMERGLVRIAGRDDSLGRPVLYGTTRKFLQVFGLNNLKDLPQVEQLKPPAES